MPLTVNSLLLTAERAGQLAAALANSGAPDPLGTLIGEAEAKVAHYTAGYQVADAVKDGFARILALYQAHVIAETTVPSDLARAHQEVLDALQAIAAGQVDNLPGAGDLAAAWGSNPRLETQRM